MKYTLRSKQLKKYLFFPLLRMIVIIVVFTIGSLVWFDVPKQQSVLVITVTLLVISVFHLIPLIILAIRHYQLSRHAFLSFNSTDNQCWYKEGDKEISFNLNEIEKVTKVVSPPVYDKRIDILGFGYFFYWKILLRDGTTLSISCMLVDTNSFFGKSERMEKKMFPIPLSNR